MTTDPVLSIAVLTYNHEKYIGQALDSILMQEVNFSYEIVIADDVSKDGTRDVINKYIAENPDRNIRTLFQEKNVGMYQNGMDLFNALKGTYAAFLEGDDYWLDKHKLQKQVDWLEQHPGDVMCFHKAQMVDDSGSNNKRFSEYYPASQKSHTNIYTLLEEGNYIPSASRVHRNVFKGAYPSIMMEPKTIPDYTLNLSLATHGDIAFMDEAMSAYRLHGGGVTADFAYNAEYQKYVSLFDAFDEFTNGKYHQAVAARRADYVYRLMQLSIQDKDKPKAMGYLKEYYRTRKYQKGFSLSLFLKTFLHIIKL